LLSSAGIAINGKNPWDIQVHDKRLYRRVLAEAELGLGESYMEGWWDCEAIDEFINRIIRADLEEKVRGNWKILWHCCRARLFNLQTKSGARKVAQQHYALSTDFFMSILDPYNQYSCGYFKGTDDLNTAQKQKLELICKKLYLSSKDRVLDIGCGWGGFAKYAATHYGCQVTGISISDEQIEYAVKYCKGLPVTIIKSDYRDMRGTFDKILVCGMIEHVGYKNYRNLMKVVDRCLTDDGLFLLHTLGRNTSITYGDPWVTKYIFPNGMIPSISQIGKAMEGIFVMEDWHNFGTDYEKTLLAWHNKLEDAWPKLRKTYDERFCRMVKYWLLYATGGFRARYTQLWQIVMTKPGTKQPKARIS
jgi:cyclopropane-fatty-acyl-phospholipid synthase